jgi:hypothetical protein
VFSLAESLLFAVLFIPTTPTPPSSHCHVVTHCSGSHSLSCPLHHSLLTPHLFIPNICHTSPHPPGCPVTWLRRRQCGWRAVSLCRWPWSLLRCVCVCGLGLGLGLGVGIGIDSETVSRGIVIETRSLLTNRRVLLVYSR